MFKAVAAGLALLSGPAVSQEILVDAFYGMCLHEKNDFAEVASGASLLGYPALPGNILHLLEPESPVDLIRGWAIIPADIGGGLGMLIVTLGHDAGRQLETCSVSFRNATGPAFVDIFEDAIKRAPIDTEDDGFQTTLAYTERFGRKERLISIVYPSRPGEAGLSATALTFVDQ